MRIFRHSILLWTLVSMACAHTNGEEKPKTVALENARLAQAQVTAAHGAPVVGNVNFEQMPNSMIVTFHLEGLQPRARYGIYLQENQNCRDIDLKTAQPLSPLRADKKGIAENTFKTEIFSVSGERAVVGGSVVVASASTDPNQPALACGTVEPLAADASFQ